MCLIFTVHCVECRTDTQVTELETAKSSAVYSPRTSRFAWVCPSCVHLHYADGLKQADELAKLAKRTAAQERIGARAGFVNREAFEESQESASSKRARTIRERKQKLAV